MKKLNIKTNQFLIILVIIMISLSSCSNPDREQKEIKELRSKVWESGKQSPDKLASNAYLVKMENFIKNYPQDSNSPKFQFEIGRVLLLINLDYPKGFEALQKVYKNYPESRFAPIALQTEAFTLDEVLKEKIKAREKYLYLIEKYPKTSMADDAKKLIEMLGKSDAEILDMLLKKEGKSEEMKDSIK